MGPPQCLRALYAQYFAVGLIYGVLPGTLYGVMMGYLKVDAHVYTTAAQIISLPWSFKFFYGLLNDCKPLFGYRRSSYMALGWSICSAALLMLANTKMPPPGDKDAAGRIAAKMAIAAAGYVMADVAADGLTVQIAKKEPLDRRGTIQSTVYFVRTVGSIVACLFVGLCMNGRQYNGTFDLTLSFNQVCAIVAVPAMLMAPISWIYIPDEPAQGQNIRTYVRECWELLKSKAMFYVVVYNLGHSVVGGISTTASGNVSLVWAGVKNLQAQLFSVLGMTIFAAGLTIVKKYMLNYSWRKVIAGATLVLGAIDCTFVMCTIYDVVRNQYFFLGEDLIVMVPAAIRFVFTTFVVVEISPDGKEGITYGMLTTLHNLGGPIARAIGNYVFGTQFDGLSDAANFHKDTSEFRNEVAWSYVVSYGCGLLSLLFLYFMPDQKVQAQAWISNWGSSKKYAVWTVVVTTVSWLYALTANILVMFPKTSCWRAVGGTGCS